MPDYKAMYFELFRASVQAVQLLQDAQAHAEQQLLAEDPPPLRLEQPEIVKQGSSYGVRLEACAPSIHMMKATIHTEISPIVGTEKQSEDLVRSLLADFADDPVKLWQSNIFGRSFHEIVGEDLQAKLKRMPADAQAKLRQALERIINEGGGGLICIIL